jgi:hypothetical protein
MKRRSGKLLAERLELIRAARGCLKHKRGLKPFTEWWAELKAEERELEDRRLYRLVASGESKRN